MQTQLIRKTTTLTSLKHNISVIGMMRKEIKKQFFSTQLCNRNTNSNKLEERKKLITENFKGCTQCGKCCTGFGSIRIYIDQNNVQQIANFMKITPNEFIQNYALSTLKQSDETSLSIKYKPSLAFHKRVQCIFLKPQTQEDGHVTYSCSIYPVRPQQCRTFPHWDEEITQDESYYNMIETCEALHSLKRSAFLIEEEDIENSEQDDDDLEKEKTLTNNKTSIN